MRKLYEDVLSSLWFRPGLWMLSSALLGVACVSADLWLIERGVDLSTYPMLQAEASSAMTMLGAIASAMLTVTSLAFSLTMIAVIQTANAYSPRLLRRYLRDARTQHALGSLLGTYVYSIVVLRSVSAGFTPLIAVNLAVALSLLSTIGLLLFLSYVSQSIKVSSIITLILDQTRRTITGGFPRDVGEAWTEDEAPDLPRAEPRVLAARESGYLQYCEHERLMRLAESHDLVVRMVWDLGTWIVAGAPLLEVWGELDDELEAQLLDVFVLGAERTLPQDASFGLLQLTDIALRALSPGINDPSTAVSAVHALTMLLIESAQAAAPSRYRCSASGSPRLILPTWSFPAVLDDTLVRVLQYGGHDVLVCRELLHACDMLMTAVSSDAHAAAVWRLVMAIRDRAETSLELANHRLQLDRQLTRMSQSHRRAGLTRLAA